MNNENKPLWKVLNENIKGEWTVQDAKINPVFDNQTFYALSVKGTFDILGFYYPYSGLPDNVHESHIKYAALCVNNFASIVEALEGLMKTFKGTRTNAHTSTEYKACVEALKAIS